MGKVKDLTGMKFGRLTVIKRTEKPEHIKSRGAYWLCKCECGNEKVVKGNDLKSGKTTSCGCLRIDDLTGMKYGRLTVIERAMDKKYSRPYWICKCECGNITKPIQGYSLTSGATTSCGCYNREKIKKLNEEQWQDNNLKQTYSQRMKDKWQDNNFRQMHKGDKNPNWKGGISPISKHLRDLNSQWFDICKQQTNYTCQLTGKPSNGDLHTHHLYAFSSIVKDAHEINNIEIKQQVKDYTQEELQLLEQYVGEWHKDNSNAVVLCEEVHMLFHNLYGYGDNTPEQFEEFKQRYLNGEFDKELNPINNKVA